LTALYGSRLTTDQESIRQDFASLTTEQKLGLLHDWGFWRRPSQVPPPEFAAGEKTYWLAKCGRGWGKTRVGSEQVREWVKTNRYVNLIGPTVDDINDAMINGESGIMAVC